MQDLLIDVSRLVGRRLKHRLPTGIDRVALAYLRHYGDHARASITVGSRSVVLQKRSSHRLFDRLLDTTADSSFLRALVLGALHSPIHRSTTGGWFLNTGHTGLHRRSYGTMLGKLALRPLFVIHDLIPITHPQFCRAPEAARHIDRMTCAILHGAAIVCNSHATFDSLADFAQSLGVQLPPVTVAPIAPEPLAAAQITAARERSPLDKRYFLMLGTIEPRKNHLLVLQVWQRLIARLGSAAPQLVLIGQKGWECEHVMRMLERTPQLREHVLWIGACADHQLNAWMANAQALLFPSFVEGFGLPVVEALQLGVPVLAADLPVFREFAGGLPQYLDPLDANGWLAAVSDYQRPDCRQRARQVEALRGYRAPTWDAHFAAVDDLIRRVDGRTVSANALPTAAATVASLSSGASDGHASSFGFWLPRLPILPSIPRDGARPCIGCCPARTRA